MNILIILFLFLGLFCFGYGAAIISYTGLQTAFLWFWVVLGALCFILSAGLRYMHSNRIWIARPVRAGFLILFLIAFALFVVVEGKIIISGSQKPKAEADYMIILGAQVRGTAVSKALKYRLDTGIIYLKNNKGTKVIVTGGQGRGEDITEAEAMYRYLVDHGIGKDRIRKEDKSTNTYENLLFSKKFLSGNNPHIVLVTNRFHVFRGTGIAKKLGFEQTQGLGAPSSDLLTLNYYVREFLAVLKDKLAGNI